LVYKSILVDHKHEIVKYNHDNGEILLKDYGESILLGNNLTNNEIISSIRVYRTQQTINKKKKTSNLCQKLKNTFLKLTA
jgi:hypothetical protein